MMLDNSITMNLDRVPIYNNKAVKKGGAMRITKNSQKTLIPTLITFNQCTQLYQIQAETGGFISMDNKYVGVKLSYSKIYNVQAPVRGGIFDI